MTQDHIMARQRSALELVHHYFMRCAQVWHDEGGKVINAEGKQIASAEGLDELCHQAGAAVASALGYTDAVIDAQVASMRKAAVLDAIFPGELTGDGLDVFVDDMAEIEAKPACEHQKKAAVFSRMLGFAIIQGLNTVDEPLAPGAERAGTLRILSSVLGYEIARAIDCILADDSPMEARVALSNQMMLGFAEGASQRFNATPEEKGEAINARPI